MQEEIGKNPLAGDHAIARAMIARGICEDFSVKELAGKVRHGRNHVVRTQQVCNDGRMWDAKTKVDGTVTVNVRPTSPIDDSEEQKMRKKLGLSEGFALTGRRHGEWDAQTPDGVQQLQSDRWTFQPLGHTTKELELKYYKEALLYRLNNYEKVKKVKAELVDEDLYAGSVLAIAKELGVTTQISDDRDADYTLILPLADLHIGEGNSRKMVESYKWTMETMIFPEIKRYVDGGGVREISIASLGDVVHCDNGSNTTTAGTQLYPQTNIYRAFKDAAGFLEWLILRLKALFKTKVSYIYVYGNHDQNLGFGLVNVLETAMRYIEGVEIVVNEKLFGVDEDYDGDNWYNQSEENPEYQWRLYGNMGITFCHGKFVKKNAQNIPDVANSNARTDAAFNAVIYGHLHHLHTADVGVGQHNYGLSTPNFVRDKFGRQLGCVMDPSFYLFHVNHNVNRIGYDIFPSGPKPSNTAA